MPTEWVLRMGNQHNNNNDFRKTITYADKILRMREIFESNGHQWTGTAKINALETIDQREPTAKIIKSHNEYFQVTGVSSELWAKFKLMLTGNYIAHQGKNKVNNFKFLFIYLFNYYLFIIILLLASFY